MELPGPSSERLRTVGVRSHASVRPLVRLGSSQVNRPLCLAPIHGRGMGVDRHFHGAKWSALHGARRYRSSHVPGLSTDRASFVGNVDPYGGNACGNTAPCVNFLNPAAFTVAPTGHLETSERAAFADPITTTWIPGSSKTFPIKSEAVRLQFRAEFFNVFNRVNYNLPSGNSTTPAFQRFEFRFVESGSGSENRTACSQAAVLVRNAPEPPCHYPEGMRWLLLCILPPLYAQSFSVKPERIRQGETLRLTASPAASAARLGKRRVPLYPDGALKSGLMPIAVNAKAGRVHNRVSGRSRCRP